MATPKTPTGTFLTLFFQPSITEIVYLGSYVKLDGIAAQHKAPPARR
jgi:hypothetical protein